RWAGGTVQLSAHHQRHGCPLVRTPRADGLHRGLRATGPRGGERGVWKEVVRQRRRKRLERMIRERWKSAGVVKTGRSGRRSDDGGTTEGCLVNSIFMPRGVPTGTWEFCHKFAFDAIQGMIFRREQRGIIRE